MTSGESLLVGPYGRELCAAIATTAAPGEKWIRPTHEEFLGALAAATPSRVAALDGHQLLSALEGLVSQAVYWQPPNDDRERLARPEVGEALRPIADAVAGHPATAWWWAPLDRPSQMHVRYWFTEWEPLLDVVDTRAALRSWRDSTLATERRDAAHPDRRSTSGQWWSDPAFTGAAWTTPHLTGVGPLRLYGTEDSMGWDRARAHPVLVDERSRVFEVAGPQDWARLVDDFPLEVTHGKGRDWGMTTGRRGRWWIPDWAAVAEEYDAVHVTVAGYLATAGWAVPTSRGATVLAGWGPAHTLWLRPDRLAHTEVVQQWHRIRSAEGDGASTWRQVPSDLPDGAVELREISDDDNAVALLLEATLSNVNWTGEQRVVEADIAADPTLAHYTRLHPERGDFALVAEVGGRVVGVVWLLFLDSADPGFGYVADGVPELSVCVWPGHRGVGLGGLLLDAAIVAARERGIRQVSLSVENGNPAARLYRSKGFVDVPGAAAGTMVLAVH